MSAAEKATINRARIRELCGDFLAQLQASGVTPIEGLFVVESLYSLLLLRGMDAAEGHAKVIDEARHVALRSLDRMQSRVLAWPARCEERQ